MEYKCEIPVEESEKRIISKLIKQVKKEWLIKEVVKSSPGFSVIYEGLIVIQDSIPAILDKCKS